MSRSITFDEIQVFLREHKLALELAPGAEWEVTLFAVDSSRELVSTEHPDLQEAIRLAFEQWQAWDTRAKGGDVL